MLPPRVMPCLLLRGTGLVKTVRFANPTYVGDPRNAVKIFNEKEVDELVLLDITATAQQREPDLKLIEEIVSEAFMPVAYGGGVRDLRQMESLLRLGVEKVALNTAAISEPTLVREAAAAFGSQSVVVSLDVRRSFFGRYEGYIRNATVGTKQDPVTLARRFEAEGAGELFLNSVDRDGTMKGFDLDLIRQVADAVRVPVIACGGAGSLDDLGAAIKQGGASAVAAGSLFVFHGKHRAVLINFPTIEERRRVLL